MLIFLAMVSSDYSVICVNICCSHANLPELGVAESESDILVCAKTKVSDRHIAVLRLHAVDGSQQMLKI